MIALSDRTTAGFEFAMDRGLEVGSEYNEIVCSGADFDGFTSFPSEFLTYEYFIYRDVFRELVPRDLRIRFHLTLLPYNLDSCFLGRTRGHYHLTFAKPPFQYFDIYQVLAGQGLFQLQYPEQGPREIYVISLAVGDIVPIPAALGHVLYNVGKTPLVVGNWCAGEEHLDYGSMKRLGGPAFEIKQDTKGLLSATRNSNPAYERSLLTVVSPESPANIATYFGFGGRMIFDWSYEGSGLRVLNDGCDSSSWLQELFRRDNAPVEVVCL